MSCTREYTTIKIINIYIGIVTIIFLESRVKMRTPFASHNRIKIVIDNSVSTIYNNSVQCRTYITLYLYYLHEFTTVIFYFRKITVVYIIYDFYIHLQSFTTVYRYYNTTLGTHECIYMLLRNSCTLFGIDSTCRYYDILYKYDTLFAKCCSSIVKCKRNVFDGFSVCYGKTFNTYQYYYNIPHNIIYEQQ